MDPAVNSEEKITDVAYSWSSDDACTPSTDPITNKPIASAMVTVTKPAPGDYSSTVSCTVTWTVHDSGKNSDRYPFAKGSAPCTVHMGVLWKKGGWGGGVLTAPQNKVSGTPAYAFASVDGTLGCSVSDPKPYDYKTFGATTTTDYGGTPSYVWTCGGGWFSKTTSPDGTVTYVTTSTSSGPTWFAPAKPAGGGVSCTIRDIPPAIGPYDGGTRGADNLNPGCTIYMPYVTTQLETPPNGVIGENLLASETAALQAQNATVARRRGDVGLRRRVGRDRRGWRN